MKTNHHIGMLLIIISSALVLFACQPQADSFVSVDPVENPIALPKTVNVEFTLRTSAEKGKLAYVGTSGDIDSVVNPDLTVQPGTVVRIILENGDGMPHDLFLPDFNVKTDYVSKIGEKTEIVFEVGDMQPGSYVYYCTVPGHRQAGQEGRLIVVEP
jgi:nitrite reductase (NO-forming)